MLDVLWQSLPLAIIASTPLLLAVEGELLVQRSGMINLGIEGLLLAAAFGASMSAAMTGSVAAGIAGGIAAAAVVALLFGLLTIAWQADQIVTGTAINLLVLGGTAFAAHELQSSGSLVPPQMRSGLVTPFAWIVVPLAGAALLWNTSIGLRLRAAGENPRAARAVGASPTRSRWLALGIEAVLAGIGGAHLALALSNGFAENMTAGRGFIALSVVIFGRWRFGGAVAGTALFGIAAALQYALQASNQGVPFHLLLATPYLVTLAILCGVAGKVRGPEALGRIE